MNSIVALQTDFLYRALNDAQEALRFTDAKAEIVIIFVGGCSPLSERFMVGLTLCHVTFPPYVHLEFQWGGIRPKLPE